MELGKEIKRRERERREKRKGSRGGRQTADRENEKERRVVGKRSAEQRIHVEDGTETFEANNQFDPHSRNA